MDINSNVNPLSEKITQKMRDQLGDTLSTLKEHAFDICKNKTNNEINISNIRTGNRTGINIASQCNNHSYIGSYHTHPDDLARLSAKDIIFACNSNIQCVGGVLDNKINCFIRKNENNTNTKCIEDAINFRRTMELPIEKDAVALRNILVKKKIPYNHVNKLMEKHVKNIHLYEERIKKLTDKYFDSINIK